MIVKLNGTQIADFDNTGSHALTADQIKDFVAQSRPEVARASYAYSENQTVLEFTVKSGSNA